jgi:membrane-bound lytic murein transglycosylase A
MAAGGWRSGASLLLLANLVALAILLWFGNRTPAPTPPPRPSPALRVSPTGFAALRGWNASDPRPGLEAFRRSCARLSALRPDTALGTGGYAGRVTDWLPVCRALPVSAASPDAIRHWFAENFAPLALEGASGPLGLFTGYYEPEIALSHVPDARHETPVYGRPSDLVAVDLGAFRTALAGKRIAGRVADGRLVPYPDRTAIDQGEIRAKAAVLGFAEDAVAAFFLQIQGSGVARFPDGTRARLAYAGDNGQAYTPIGRVLIRKGALARKDVSLQTIRAWLHAHPADAAAVME